MGLIHLNFRSWCLQTNTDVQIILPSMKQGEDAEKYYCSDKKYPVLWLLHGTFGGYNDYLRRTNIEFYATENDLIVVMPSVMNSEYSNWPDFMLGYNAYDYLIKELMPMIYGWFPASNKREDNYICGLSMGAMGAAKYAVNYPDKFAGCSCMSGAPINVKKLYESKENNEFSKRMFRNIEHAGGIDNYLNSYENVWGKISDIANKDNCPRFYFSCGKQDALYASYKEFEEYAKEVKLDAKFEELDGYAHEWRFWELEIQRTLEFFGFDKKHTTPSNVNLKKIDGSSL